MAAESRDAATIKDDGWRQGSALPADLAETLSREGLLRWAHSVDDVLIVISHDCDVTNASLRIEPDVELLRLMRVSTRDGNFDWGKHPRRYQFTDDRGSPPATFEASVHDRVIVSRDRLIGFKPDIATTVDSEARSRLARWIAARYVRAAFPDSFNRRIQPAVGPLRAAFKSKGWILSGIYLLVNDDELPADDDYRVVLVATMLDEHYADREKRIVAQSLVDRIEAIFQECTGVDFLTELRSESEVSLHDMRKLKRWDFDDLSLRQGQVEDLPPNP
jgi:hypothetical protein